MNVTIILLSLKSDEMVPRPVGMNLALRKKLGGQLHAAAKQTLLKCGLRPRNRPTATDRSSSSLLRRHHPNQRTFPSEISVPNLESGLLPSFLLITGFSKTIPTRDVNLRGFLLIIIKLERTFWLRNAGRLLKTTSHLF